ncbi:sepiapterin reductase [Legionella moravica]|uniref:Estradiol 17-beta-dehydrogenase n=1 Tax=Legionella moravica TaxID=39962 RepID=A0A378JW32_9GAMM|nr:SDR family oxidoreductase [Legionella moravica]KTD37662.1 sepiapterin reductase [Legionella moravica]STX61692.1 estradiol 17-beta-dehydrogenase [Legionella moravica]HEN5528827.1 SDR family oxidoreductase [Legionella pneumophila]
MKAALITGATHGIGLALTRNLLSKGWTVFGVGRDQDSLDRTSSEFATFRPICADLTNNDDLKKVADVVNNTKIPLNILVQNAGMKTPPRDLEKHTCEAIDEVIGLNLSAPMKLTALLIPCMPSGSRILYVTSRAATLKLMQSSTYCATKAALDEVAAIVRQELREKNIAVGSVIPGEVNTSIQKTLRETTGFHLHRMFQQAYESGQLIRPEICADFLKWLLCDLSFEEFNNGEIHTIYDDAHHKYWLANPEDLPAFPFEDKPQNTLLMSKL